MGVLSLKIEEGWPSTTVEFKRGESCMIAIVTLLLIMSMLISKNSKDNSPETSTTQSLTLSLFFTRG